MAEPIDLTLGLNTFRNVLEDEGQHVEDAVKAAISVVVNEDRRKRPKTIDRDQWNTYCPAGDSVDCKTTVRSEGVDIEDYDGRVEISVFTREDGVDVRVSDIQLVVKGTHIALLQKHPPYPVTEWAVLFEGEMA